MSGLTIRPATPDDAAAVRRVNEAAFATPAEANLVEQLHAHGQVYIEHVAQLDDEIVGHILISPVIIVGEFGECAALALAPMAVRPAWQRRGIGSALVTVALAECRARGATRLVVLGHAAYYPRFGFVPASRYGLRCEFDVPDEVFMALAFAPGAFDRCRGVVRYAPAFTAV
jgi:putative acetyltransferase